VPVIGRDGLLRLVEWAERLRPCLESGGRPQPGASPPHGACEESFEDGVVDIVPGGEQERGSGVTDHAPGAVGGGAGGGEDRG